LWVDLMFHSMGLKMVAVKVEKMAVMTVDSMVVD